MFGIPHSGDRVVSLLEGVLCEVMLARASQGKAPGFRVTADPGEFSMEVLWSAARAVEWHGVVLGAPDWSNASHSLAATFHFDSDRLALHLMINAYWETLAFAIPPLDEVYLPWRRCVDTFRPAPEDICGWLDAEVVSGETLVVQPRSIVVLVTKYTPVGTQS